jgi:hypothetical protein
VWRGNAAQFLILALASVLLSPGCATLTRSRQQRVFVTSAPLGAAVTVNGVEKGVTPLMMKLDRRLRHPVIRIESPGYNPVEIRPIRRPSGTHFFSNILVGLIPAIVPAGVYSLAHDGEGAMMVWILSAAAFGGLFTAVDSGTGTIYDFRPTEITVILKKADGPPRVDTILIDADDFQNVKWLRVHRD